jgi:GntR family transcriptional regulator, rspAB operon transcriptional repressor
MPETKHLRRAVRKNPDRNGAPLLRQVAYERIKDAIRNGELQPGELLSEVRLSEALEISRTPVREALQQLAQEGLVQIRPNRTVVVAALSMQEVVDILHLRSLLEPELVRLVAESANPTIGPILEERIAEMEDAAQRGDRAAWSRADTHLHETLSAACPNALLGQLELQMRNRMQLVAISAETTAARLNACTAEHKAIITAILEGDGAKAHATMQEHMRSQRESLFTRFVHA